MEDGVTPIPAPAENDHEQVATALETAGIFWKKRDLAEALRWVRRAAEAASEAEDDVRALALARQAAELSEQYQVRLSAPPPPPRRSPAPAKPEVAQGPPAAPPTPQRPAAPPTHPSTTPKPPVASTPKPPIASTAKVAPGLRQTVRVSLEAASEPDAFIMRPLPDGLAAPPGSHEALVVLVDPKAKLFG